MAQIEFSLHSFIEEILRSSGATPVECVLAPKRGRNRADFIFPEPRVVAEIKSLETDRAEDAAVLSKLNELITLKGPSMGGPVIFGEVSISLDQLPDKLARQAFRLLTKQVQKAVDKANRQIKETKQDLDWPEAHGLLVFAAPPMTTDLHLIGWAVHDALRAGQNSSIDSLLLFEIDAPDEQTRNVVASFHDKDTTNPLSNEIKDGIAEGIGKLVGGPMIEGSEEDFFNRFSPKRLGPLG